MGGSVPLLQDYLSNNDSLGVRVSDRVIGHKGYTKVELKVL